jgi:hypothetical protein
MVVVALGALLLPIVLDHLTLLQGFHLAGAQVGGTSYFNICAHERA